MCSALQIKLQTKCKLGFNSFMMCSSWWEAEISRNTAQRSFQRQPPDIAPQVWKRAKKIVLQIFIQEDKKLRQMTLQIKISKKFPNAFQKSAQLRLPRLWDRFAESARIREDEKEEDHFICPHNWGKRNLAQEKKDSCSKTCMLGCRSSVHRWKNSKWAEKKPFEFLKAA